MKIFQGDTLSVLRELPDCSVNCCVTSPPYWGLRDYGVEGQLGLEKTPEEYVAKMVEVFREVKRVLRDDGTLRLNIGDSYNAQHGQRKTTDKVGAKQETNGGSNTVGSRSVPYLKPKDLVGIPWMLAFALRADDWYLRQDIIWAKPNPMPESVTDRCTKSHEYIFLMSKSPRYYFAAEAIKESSITNDQRRPYGGEGAWQMDGRPQGQRHGGELRSSGNGRTGRNAFRGQGANRSSETGPANRDGREMKGIGAGEKRNKRDVWTVATTPFKGAHFATFPPKLIEPCILAGCPAGGVVMDTFAGAATTGLVAIRNQRDFIGVELNPEYVTMGSNRLLKEVLS